MFQFAPQHVALSRAAVDPAWKLKTLVTKGLHRRGGRTSTPKRTDDLTDTLLNTGIGIEARAPLCVMDKANRQPHLELATASFVEGAATQPRTHDVQLGLAHCALQTEQQPIIEMRWVVDAIFVKDQAVCERADLQQTDASRLSFAPSVTPPSP